MNNFFKKIKVQLAKASLIFLSIYAICVLYCIIIHPVSLESLFLGASMKMSSNWEIRNSAIVNDTVNFCAPFKGQNQVDCVVSRIGGKFTYNMSDRTTDIKITDDIPSGYICRDIAVAYDAIFTKLEYRTDYTFTENHVYNHIWTNDINCEINMDSYNCW